MLPRLCRVLSPARRGLNQLLVLHKPGSLQVQSFKLLQLASSSSVAVNRKVIATINKACSAGNIPMIESILEENENVQLGRNIALTKDMEKVFRRLLSERPLNHAGMLVLRFLLRHGEENTQVEREALSILLEDIDEYNALGLATVLQCFFLVNTDLRWRVVMEFERALKAGLNKESITSVLSSLRKFSRTALVPHLLQSGYTKTLRKGRSNVAPDICLKAMSFVSYGDIVDNSFCKKIEIYLASLKYSRFRFGIADVKQLLFLSAKAESRNTSYLMLVSQHLLESLAVTSFEDIGKNQIVLKQLESCLISYAIIGYYQEDVIERLEEHLKQVQFLGHKIRGFCALSMLDHSDDLGYSRDEIDDLLASKLFQEKANYTWLRALVDEKYLSVEHATQLLAKLVTSIPDMIENDTLTLDQISSYFLLKAFLELDMETKVDVDVDERLLLSKIQNGELSTLRATIRFVLTEIYGDDRWFKCGFCNEYGHYIDVEFYLDREGNICEGDSDNKDLTRFLILGLDEKDLIVCYKDFYQEYKPRKPHHTKIRQLSKTGNTKIITVFYNEWDELKDRHGRMEFLQKKIKAELEEQEKAESC